MDLCPEHYWASIGLKTDPQVMSCACSIIGHPLHGTVPGALLGIHSAWICARNITGYTRS
jgi:hypothetical protein